MEVNIPDCFNICQIDERRALFESRQNEEKEKLNKLYTEFIKEKENTLSNYMKTISRYSLPNCNDTDSKEVLELKKAVLMTEMNKKLEAFKNEEDKWSYHLKNLERRLEEEKKAFEINLRNDLATEDNFAKQNRICETKADEQIDEVGECIHSAKTPAEEQINECNRKRKAEEQINEYESETKLKKDSGTELQQLKEQLELKKKEAKTMMESLGRDLECGVCAEICIESVQLNCGHIFCKFCIDTWKKQKKECPMCRTKIKNEMRSWHYEGIIEKIIKFMPEDERKQREELIKRREYQSSISSSAVRQESILSSIHRRRQQSVSNRNTTPTIGLNHLITHIQNQRSIRSGTIVARNREMIAWVGPPRINVPAESTVTSTRVNDDVHSLDYRLNRLRNILSLVP